MKENEDRERYGSGSVSADAGVSHAGGVVIGEGEDRLSRMVGESYEAMSPMERAVLRLEAQRLIEERPDLVRRAVYEARAAEVLREVVDRFVYGEKGDQA